MTKDQFIGPYVYVGYHCNNDCVFCSEGDDYFNQLKLKSFKEIKKEIEEVRKRYDFINIMGREPTIRPDFLDILSFVSELKFNQFGFTTNGRLLSYVNFSKKVLESGVNQVAISLIGANAKTHDSQTRVPGSFVQTINGIKNIISFKKENTSVLINIPLSKLNYLELDEMICLLIDLGVEEINILNVAPLSLRSKNKNIIMEMSKVGKHLFSVLKSFQNNIGSTKILLVEFLPCSLPKELRSYFFPCLEKNSNKIRIPICSTCEYAKDCDGVLSDYISLYGLDNFKI